MNNGTPQDAVLYTLLWILALNHVLLKRGVRNVAAYGDCGNGEVSLYTEGYYEGLS